MIDKSHVGEKIVFALLRIEGALKDIKDTLILQGVRQAPKGNLTGEAVLHLGSDQPPSHHSADTNAATETLAQAGVSSDGIDQRKLPLDDNNIDRA